MTHPLGQFERLEHYLPSLGPYTVPLYLDSYRNVTPESGALLRSVEIIGSRLGEVSLASLIDQVGAVVSEPSTKQGIIIEDESGLGSVTVAPDITTVSVRNQGKLQVPSPLFFDMLYVWADYNSVNINKPPVE